MVSQLLLMGGTPREANFPLITPILEPGKTINPPSSAPAACHSLDFPLTAHPDYRGGFIVLNGPSWGTVEVQEITES